MYMYVVYVPAWKLPNPIMEFLKNILNLMLILNYRSPHVLLNSIILAFAFGRAYDILIFCAVKEIWLRFYNLN